MKMVALGTRMVDVRKWLRNLMFLSTRNADNKIQVDIDIKFKNVRRKIERKVYDHFGGFTRPVAG